MHLIVFKISMIFSFCSNVDYLLSSHWFKKSAKISPWQAAGLQKQPNFLPANLNTSLFSLFGNFSKSKSYLYTIANNAFLNEVAHKKVVLQYQKGNVKKSTNINPEFLLEEKEFQSKLNKAISNLPIKQREVFLLSRIDKKKYSEIAVIVGITVKAVEKRMSQALMILREKIGNI